MSTSADDNTAELSRIASSISGFNIIWISKDEGSSIFSPTAVAVGIELVHQNILEPQK